MCRDCAQAFPTTVEVDNQILKGHDLSDGIRLAVTFRKTRKLLLLKTAAWLESIRTGAITGNDPVAPSASSDSGAAALDAQPAADTAKEYQSLDMMIEAFNKWFAEGASSGRGSVRCVVPFVSAPG